jgi:SAM-dependent methyltransferase
VSVFREYAEYYDLLYADKDYPGEAEFVLARLGQQPKGARLLELGSGTGRHAEAFARLGFAVTGVDLSPEMVRQAEQRSEALGAALIRPKFQVGDVRHVRTGMRYEAVVSLFHVFSYQVNNHDLLAAFQSASEHLLPGGTFFFDFWYGPAVLRDPPVVRVRRMRGSDFNVTRLAEPLLLESQNRVDVNYEVIIERDAGGTPLRTREVHPMRYLFLPEIIQNLNQVGLELVDSGAWMCSEPLSLNAWYGWVSARTRIRSAG